ncbi:2-hydroxychromene-2-carboxylate isomerase [Dyella sp. BiH032]|uniref:2-hydroxychromene-2-carboxylate isomerase n=1 Tax=Dyella sp. BiH032 TaxID=3075430 RepID=UPI0028936246|nr:2-hydroxychromene-2-carboxylate isomerase [Dyella sp. BiH032]WNL44164.1 2-hydroxychromene-2-carboxylate isomerase [Dyella sp. BiH032]
MIECWFEFGSNYSYLSVMRIEQEAAVRGVRVVWRPFLLGPIFKAMGWDSSPFVLQKAKGDYVWQDMPRQCRKYGLPWQQPSRFPRRALLPMRVALLGEEQPWMAEYCRRVMRMNFGEDRDIDNPEAVREALEGLGVSADELLREAASDEVKQRLRERTEAAAARGVFGAPTFFVRGERYWGNDRLEDALEAAMGAVAW